MALVSVCFSKYNISLADKESQECFSKENQKHINPKRLKVRRNYNSIWKGSKGSGYNSNRDNFRGKAGRGRGNYSTKLVP